MGRQFTFSIGQKLLVLALVPLVALAGIGIYNYVSGSKTMDLMKWIHASGQKVEMISINLSEPINRLRETSLSIALAPDDKFREKIAADYDALVTKTDGGFAKLKEESGAGDKDLLAATEEAWRQYKVLSAYTRKQMEIGYREAAFINVNGPEREQFRQLTEKLTGWQESAAKQSESSYNQAREEADQNLWLSIGTIVGLLAVLSALTVWMGRSIILPIKNVIASLTAGAYKVSEASIQLSGSADSLASGSSEQVASLEEASASIEEMASMTKQTSQNSIQVDRLMKEVNKTVQDANDAMKKLIDSMAQITAASEETSKIIKTIDEIAFQTNLLALNAAVEAARAGEAGAGFAVVADEVRNLAMRAADAAKNTAGLIESTVTKVKDGSDFVNATNQSFLEVSKNARKVGELIEEISSASKEQASGIDQVNAAVAEMGKVTQQNAAHAEESASAVGEMSAQAEQINGLIANLEALVGGNGNGNGKNRLINGKENAPAKDSIGPGARLLLK